MSHIVTVGIIVTPNVAEQPTQPLFPSHVLEKLTDVRSEVSQWQPGVKY